MFYALFLLMGVAGGIIYGKQSRFLRVCLKTGWAYSAFLASVRFVFDWLATNSRIVPADFCTQLVRTLEAPIFFSFHISLIATIAFVSAFLMDWLNKLKR